MPQTEWGLTPLDIFVFTAVLVLTIASVLYGQRMLRRQNPEGAQSAIEVLLMGRRLTLPLFVPTLVATWYGGLFGVTALSFERGIFNFVTQGFFWYLTYLLFAFFLVKRIRRFRATGLADLAGQAFGPRARKLTACLAFTNLLPIGYISGLGFFLGSIWGMDWWGASLLGLAMMFSYALWGGLRAVVFSDIVQCFVMVVGVWVLVLVCWNDYGGLDFLRARLPEGHWDPTGGNDWGELFIWGFIALGTLVDPNFHQRVFAAADDKTAQRGIIASTIIWFFFDIATTCGGLYARAILPHARAEDSYLQLGLTVLPSGLKGLFLAGILATILSTLDSYLFTAGATLTCDLWGSNSKWAVRGAMVGTGLLAWALAPLFGGSVVQVWKTLGGLASASLVPALIYGLCFPGRLSEKGFLLSVGLGMLGTASFGLTRFWHHLSLEEFYVGLTMSMLGLILALNFRHFQSAKT